MAAIIPRSAQDSRSNHHRAWSGTTFLLAVALLLGLLPLEADGFMPSAGWVIARVCQQTDKTVLYSTKSGGSGSAGRGSGGGNGDARKPRPKNRLGRRQEQLEGMAVGGKFELGYDLPDEEVPLEEDETLPVVRTIAAAADKRKGEDIFAIRVSSLTIVSSFFVLITGNSRPQIQAIAAAVLEDVEEQHQLEPRNGGEGTADSGWILLDFGSVIVNVMTPTARQYYNLEKLWRKGEVCDLSDIIKPNTPFDSSTSRPSLGETGQDSSDEEGDGSATEPDETDPFWS